jgi:hypothetical protein
MLEEHWVPIEGFPGYAVSNYGNVENVNTGREIKAVPNKDGHLKVLLYRDGRRMHRRVHHLVANAFFLNYRQGMEVRFLNGNKRDCSVLNLTLGRV